MPRSARITPGGTIFHVLNRGVVRMRLFEKDADYQAFEQVIIDTLKDRPMRILAYCLMPNHWHFLLWPYADGDMAAFMQCLTLTHVRRWQEFRHQTGSGHLYQSRYKSFPVEEDEHFTAVARYIERNALRANLVKRAEQWHWSSLWRRCMGSAQEKSILADWPVKLPGDWVERVNQADNEKELSALRQSIERGRPFGNPDWQTKIAQQFGLDSTYRDRGRPRKFKK
jgi:putative transposase